MSKESTATANSADAQKGMPKDALVMGAILKEMGVNEYEPQVVNQMLEFTYRYVTTVLEEAKVLADHAQKSSIDADDVKMGISLTNEHSFSLPPPREFLLELAREKNSQPLPPVGEKFGVRLPPERYCLLANNYQLVKNQGKGQSSRGASRSSSVSQLPSPTPSNILIPSAQNLSAIAAMKSPIAAATSALTLPLAVSSAPSPAMSTGVKLTTAVVSPANTPTQPAPAQEVVADEVGVMEDSGDSDDDQGDMSMDTTRRGLKRAHEDDDYDNL